MRRLVLATVLCLGACDDDDDGDGDAEQACLDVADAIADAAVRCGAGTYETNYDGFIDIAACGDCGNIVDLRDRGDLYAACIPSFGTISCEDLTGGNLDASCNDQLLRQYDDCGDY